MSVLGLELVSIGNRMSDITVIIPHKRMEENDKALLLNLRMLLDNSCSSLEIIIDTESPKDPYIIYNEVARSARSEIIVMTNSDVLMAPDWDRGFIDHMQDNAILTGYLVEPKNVGVAGENIEKNFGKTPDTFDRNEFEGYAMSNGKPAVKEQRGWYMPCAFKKNWFLSTGGFDTSEAFPHASDVVFWDRCIKEFGTKLLRVNSFAYHFQALSHRSG